MLKLIVFLLSLFVVGFLIIHDNWMITISGFGYEVTISTVLLACLFLLLLYILHLLKKPLGWFGWVQHRMSAARYAKREAYLTKLLQFILEENTQAAKNLFKQKKGLFDKKDVKNLLIEGLLNPNKEVFEQLAKHKETELAGLKGLYEEAVLQGNLREQDKILHQAGNAYGSVCWVATGQYKLSLLQGNWQEALDHLETLKKMGFVEKANYATQKADLLMKNNQPEEAFKLNPKNTHFALAAAQNMPQKSAEILMKAWREVPAKEVYEAYMLLFSKETSQKQMKAVKKLIADNPSSKTGLLALADTAVRLEMWVEAKESLQVYMDTYPLTKTAARLMAQVVREGWHHEEEAKEWDQKALETVEQAPWVCTACNQESLSWDIACPHCLAFHKIVNTN